MTFTITQKNIDMQKVFKFFIIADLKTFEFWGISILTLSEKKINF